MPELPEVETARRNVEKALKGRTIERAVVDREDRIVFDRARPAEVAEALGGAKVLGIGRKGKYLWIELDRRPWPVIHLGMTGILRIRKTGKKFTKAWGGLLWNEAKVEAGSPVLPYSKLRLFTADGVEVALSDPRRFGRVRLAEDPLHEPPISRLGFDPLEGVPTAKALATLLKKRKLAIKAVLLDQSVFAGVGNWMADEILYQAGISPKRPASSLTLAEVQKLRGKLLSIVKTAVAVQADYDRYPVSWLFHHRWGKKKDARTSRKHRIAHATIGGRTTAWVPEVQR